MFLSFLFFFSPLFLFFLSLLAWADICTAELATWGVGPDVIDSYNYVFMELTEIGVKAAQ